MRVVKQHIPSVGASQSSYILYILLPPLFHIAILASVMKLTIHDRKLLPTRRVDEVKSIPEQNTSQDLELILHLQLKILENFIIMYKLGLHELKI